MFSALVMLAPALTTQPSPPHPGATRRNRESRSSPLPRMSVTPPSSESSWLACEVRVVRQQQIQSVTTVVHALRRSRPAAHVPRRPCRGRPRAYRRARHPANGHGQSQGRRRRRAARCGGCGRNLCQSSSYDGFPVDRRASTGSSLVDLEITVEVARHRADSVTQPGRRTARA